MNYANSVRGDTATCALSTIRPKARDVSGCHNDEKIFCAIPLSRLTRFFCAGNPMFTNLPHVVGKVSFTTSRLRGLSDGAHTWGQSLIATPNLADAAIATAAALSKTGGIPAIG